MPASPKPSASAAPRKGDRGPIRDLLAERSRGPCPETCAEVRYRRRSIDRRRMCERELSPAAPTDAVVDRPPRRRCPGRCSDLRVDVLDVSVGGLGRDEQPFGDLSRGEALGDETQDLDLSPRQSGRSVSRSPETKRPRLSRPTDREMSIAITSVPAIWDTSGMRAG